MERTVDYRFNDIVRFFGSLVPHTLTSEDYSGFDEMAQDFEETGSIKINTLNSTGTIFGDPSVNWLFRVWHDYAHIRTGAGFDFNGEITAMRLQIADVYAHSGLTEDEKTTFSHLLTFSVQGTGEYYITHGQFPPNEYEYYLEWRNHGTDIG